MAKKFKHTKNELKTQRDALKRYQRYLPTLQLKKQQLQLEVRQLEARIREEFAKISRLREDLSTWLGVVASGTDLLDYVSLEAVREREGNIAGVSIPILEHVEFNRVTPDLFETPAWLDDGVEALEDVVRLWLVLHVLREQHRRLSEELRSTNQRVNLFEKVTIPTCKENIRVIRIFLGDQQTAEVARAKIAKGKTEREEAA
jgi:V/A-type H+-transporting ATPase subunit D